ncbi:unnamed protein product [Cladocopium goreaui]|uniref:At4g15545-like C-terminal domain-containing protein n=1 Tax=Cladocopium goreaui TaxID=2562237 RepID=A0A9P1FRY1_9DINO|nr:unnamed protein product [Cladocopium goreaui]
MTNETPTLLAGAACGMERPDYGDYGNSEDGLTVGIQVIQRAFQRKVNSLEQEIKKMELTCEEHRASVTNLDRKTSALQVELVESKERWEQLQDEEKELYKTLGSLKKQILRLESLKAAVLKEIQDDQHKEAELGELKSLMSDEYFRGTMPLTAGELGYGPSREAPRFSPVTSGPQVFPSEPRTQGPRAPVAASLPSYGGRSDDASIGSRPPVVDGKAFFRLARSRLPIEDFNKFLASIKRLNNQQQTREDTMKEASRIFGPERADLFRDFEALLTRHGM